MSYHAMRGTRDILPAEAAEWRYLEEEFRQVAARYGYGEIRTPLFEARELFIHGTGETSEVVTKEMYEFQDRKGRWLSLRPEGTPPVVRAYLEHGLARQGLPIKLFYIGAMFRYDRPAAGRYRQFHQVGVEAIGSPAALLDAEVVALLHDYLLGLGLIGLETRLNSLGCAECRPAFREKLVVYLAPVKESLCPDCLVRYEKNPLRILDCKVPECRALLANCPTPLETLCAACRDHLAEVEGHLRSWGIGFHRDGRLVRGLDYYTRTVFETYAPIMGGENALGGGGRYDGLVAVCGGPPTPATGFSAGLERIHEALRAAGVALPGEPATQVYIAVQNQVFAQRAAGLLARLRRKFTAQMDYDARGLRSQLKAADRQRARFVVLFADDEMARGELKVRDMVAGDEVNVREAEVPAWLEARLGEGGVKTG